MSNTLNKAEATPVQVGSARAVYSSFPLSNEELEVIDSASRKPFAWHGYKPGSGYSKILGALNKKGIIQFHVTQNLFKILPSAFKR